MLHIFRFVAIHLVRAAFFPMTGVDIYVFTWALRFDVLLYISISHRTIPLCGTLINYIANNKMQELRIELVISNINIS